MHQKGESMVASDIWIAVGDRACGISVVRVALVFILASAAMSAQAGQVPREPYSCRLYADAGGHCAFLIVLIGVVIGGYIASSASACATAAVSHEPRC
jgi:cytochrome b561